MIIQSLSVPCRLTIDRLENEKKELEYELSSARRQAGTADVSWPHFYQFLPIKNPESELKAS